MPRKHYTPDEIVAKLWQRNDLLQTPFVRSA
jgi:hypothetical protein